MKEQKYTAEALLDSKAFSHYQKDFLRAILGDGEYTVAQAEKKIQSYFSKEGK